MTRGPPIADARRTGAAIVMASAVMAGHPRVDEKVGDVHQRVDDPVHERDEERDAHDRRKVDRQRALVRVPTEPGPGEDRLGEDGARQELRVREPGQREGREQRVRERVVPHDTALRHALGPGRPHVVLPQRFQHGRPRGAGHDADRRRRQDHRGQNEMGEGVPDRGPVPRQDAVDDE
jgi:hypothetical protein